MSRQRPRAELEKVTINLRSGDALFLNEHLPEAGGYSAVIRQIVAAWVDKIKAEKVAKGLQDTEAVNV